MNSDAKGYESGFCDGARAVRDLLQAGAVLDDIIKVLPEAEPADRDGYQQLLADLRTILGTNLTGGDDEA